MNSNLSHSGALIADCECSPECLDIATGVLMQRDGLPQHEARETLLRSAERQNTSVHAVSEAVIDAAIHARS